MRTQVLTWPTATLMLFGLAAACSAGPESVPNEQGGTVTGGDSTGATAAAASGPTDGAVTGTGGAATGGVAQSAAGTGIGGGSISAGGNATGGVSSEMGGLATGGTSSGTGGLATGGTSTGTGGLATGGTSTGAGGVGSGTPSSGCSATNVATGAAIDATLTVGGQERTYRLSVPTDYVPAEPLPVVFGLNGVGGDGLGAQQAFALETNRRAIFVYPDGLGAPGDTGWPNTDGRDVAFFDAMVEFMDEHYCVDAHRIFATGHSYGGYMSNTLGCQRADALRGIAPVAEQDPAEAHRRLAGRSPRQAVLFG